MDLPASAYLYTLAVMAMTLVGFTVIVMILRQSLGGGALSWKQDNTALNC
jgi:hypothetical protein